MKLSLLTFSVVTLLSASLSAQSYRYSPASKFNKKVREESYEAAKVYATKQLERLKNTKNDYKYLRKALPYYSGLAMVNRKMGDFSTAEKLYLEAKALSEEKQSKKSTKKLGRADLDLMDALADMQMELGNYKSAADLLGKSIKEREYLGRGNPERYRPYLLYGKYLMTMGKDDEAHNYVKDYILYIRNTWRNSKAEMGRFAEAYATLALIELQRGNAEEATRFATLNLKYQKHGWVREQVGKNNLNRIESYNLMARCFLQQENYIDALNFSSQAVNLYDQAVGKPTIYKVSVLCVRAEILWIQKEYEKAFQLFKEANQIQIDFANQNLGRLSEYEKENFSTKLKQNTTLFFAFATDLLLQNVPFQNDLLTEVYYVQLNTKAKILDESNRLRAAIAASENTTLQQLYMEWGVLKNEYARMITTGNSSQSQTKELEAKIDGVEKKLNELASVLTGVQSVETPSTVAQRLKVDQVAIEIIRVSEPSHSSVKKNKKDEPGYLLLSITKEKSIPAFGWIKDGNFLEGRAYQFYTNTKKNRIDDTVSYKHFFAPIIELAGDKRKLYISADGIFNLINLNILSHSKERYVQASYSIINLTNTKNIGLAGEKAAYKTATLFGRPQYNSDVELASIKSYTPDTVSNRAILDFNSEINDLPGTEIEVKAIQKLLTEKGIISSLNMYDEANENALKSAESKDILHIATHGFFLDEVNTFTNPMLRSSLLLAGVKGSHEDKREDGILTAYEANLLNLKDTELVVLSACETGLGDIKNGEGIYGLQRAFEAAGVRNILMSLWKVDDEATMLLMKIFYEELVNSNDAVLALNKAQGALRSKYSHPYYWGAFKLMGE